jgi:hypothetical protein
MAKLTANQKKWFEYMALMLELHHDNGVRFDLGRWINYDARDDDGWCGTKACACGLASINPTFNQAGFKRLYENSFRFTFENKEGWGAVTAFFKITMLQAEYLFAAWSYKGKTKGDEAARNVARRIREFIKTNGKLPKTFKGGKI